MPIDATGAPISGDAIAPDVDLKGKVAVVTGASRSIGKGIALELGAAGATVYVTGPRLSRAPYPARLGKLPHRSRRSAVSASPSRSIITRTIRSPPCSSA